MTSKDPRSADREAAEASPENARDASSTPAIPSGVEAATFLADPVTDQLVRVVMELGAALWVERRRTRTLERVLVSAGALAPNAMEQWVDEPADAAADSEELAQFMRRTFGPLAYIGPADRRTGESQ